jgi:hypothetical protein
VLVSHTGLAKRERKREPCASTACATDDAITIIIHQDHQCGDHLAGSFELINRFHQ